MSHRTKVISILFVRHVTEIDQLAMFGSVHKASALFIVRVEGGFRARHTIQRRVDPLKLSQH